MRGFSETTKGKAQGEVRLQEEADHCKRKIILMARGVMKVAMG